MPGLRTLEPSVQAFRRMYWDGTRFMPPCLSCDLRGNSQVATRRWRCILLQPASLQARGTQEPGIQHQGAQLHTQASKQARGRKSQELLIRKRTPSVYLAVFTSSSLFDFCFCLRGWHHSKNRIRNQPAPTWLLPSAVLTS